MLTVFLFKWIPYAITWVTLFTRPGFYMITLITDSLIIPSCINPYLTTIGHSDLKKAVLSISNRIFKKH